MVKEVYLFYVENYAFGGEGANHVDVCKVPNFELKTMFKTKNPKSKCFFFLK